MFNSWKEWVSRSNVLKNTTDSHEGDKLRKWARIGCSLYVSGTTMFKISMSDGIRHFSQQMNRLRRRSWKDCTDCWHDQWHFSAIGAYEAVQGLPDLFNIRLQDYDVQDFDTRWDQALLAASERPNEMVLEGWHKSKLQDTVQLQNVLTLYDQETVRNNGQTSYSRLKIISEIADWSKDENSEPQSLERHDLWRSSHTESKRK